MTESPFDSRRIFLKRLAAGLAASGGLMMVRQPGLAALVAAESPDPEYNAADHEYAFFVDVNKCIGCGYCVQACPYGSRFINPHTHTADKCTFCYHRITRGYPPACVLACPRSARLYGNLNDPEDRLSVLLRQHSYRLLKPEMGTHPECYYLGLDREVV